MSKAVGRLQRPREREYRLRSALMAFYAVNAHFMPDLIALLERFRGALSQLAVLRCPSEPAAYYFWPHHDEGWAKACVIANGWQDLQSYPDELRALAEKWGLRCPWAAPWLHACLIEYLAPVYPRPSRPEPSLRPHNGNVDMKGLLAFARGKLDISTKVTYQPWPPEVLRDPSQDLQTLAQLDPSKALSTARQRAKEETLAQLRQRMDEIDRECLDRGYNLQDKEPELRLHIYWLYLRMCPQLATGSATPLGWTDIRDLFKDYPANDGKGQPKYKYLTPTSGQKVVEPLAKEMAIELPPLRPGRPPNY